MLHVYCPEMGEKEPLQTVTKKCGHLTLIKQASIEMSARLSFYGKYWFVTSQHELKGQGITKVADNKYRVTDRAFEKLQAEHEIKMINYLD